jgi:hypothetical protein
MYYCIFVDILITVCQNVDILEVSDLSRQVNNYHHFGDLVDI